jgi:hypothetical protein
MSFFPFKRMSNNSFIVLLLRQSIKTDSIWAFSSSVMTRSVATLLGLLVSEPYNRHVTSEHIWHAKSLQALTSFQHYTALSTPSSCIGLDSKMPGFMPA